MRGHPFPECPKIDVPANKLAPCPGNHSQTCGQAWQLEVLTFACHEVPGPPSPSPAPAIAGLNITWTTVPNRETPPDRKTLASIPTQALSPALPVVEAKRDALQKALAIGWGPWMHSNMLDIVKLPDAATISTQLCTVTHKCLDTAVPDGASPRPHNTPGTATRVGHHAFDRSYVQFYFGSNERAGLPFSFFSAVFGARGGTEPHVVAFEAGTRVVQSHPVRGSGAF